MNKEDYLDKYFYHSKDNDGNKLFDREVCLKAMKDYAIAMCDYQKKECAEKLDIAGAHFTNYDGYEWLASNIVLETKNVAE